ncbi:MAG: T9SS type A sorting domain-containing protein [Candidatus Cloacimonetes bacterium]|nr:T9SS type A sorting domain-containing protein [Candidatus Cloacimonadota bacterium]
MKKSILKNWFILLLMFFSTISFLFAKEFNIDLINDENRITVTENTYEKLSISYCFSKIKSFEVQTKKGVFNEIIIPNTYYIGEIGTPKLPTSKKLIEIPFGAQVSVNVRSYTIAEYKLSDYGITNPIMPVQPSLPKSIDPTTVEFEYNEDSYSQDAFTEHELATVEILGVLRGVRLARIDVSLVRYNPVTGVIQVYNNIEVDVNLTDSDRGLTEYTKASTYSPYFESIYERIINYRQHGYPAHPDLTTYPVKYLIVSHRMFETQLQPFIEWKTQKGFTVIVAYTDTLGSSAYNIQTWIHSQYAAGTPTDPAPSFVLLVGDTGQITASATGSTTGKVTDLYYCSVDGDYFPEMYYGRFSATNTTHAQTQINRTLYYEKYEFNDPSFLDDVTLIAGVDGYWNPHVGQPTVLYGTNNYFNAAYGFDEVHAYLTTYSGCYDTIDDGICMINYTAHGSQTSWGNPSMTQTMVNNLTNVSKYPLAIGNCCLACDFGYPECFGETWARATHNTIGDPTGAIGYIGSAPSSYWWEDFYWAVGAFPTPGGYVPTYNETSWGMFDGPFVSDYVTQDALIFVGNLAVTEAHTEGYPTHVGAGPIYYWQAYNLLGDPSLVVYMTQGEVNDVSFAGLLPIGSTSFTVDAEPGSYVGISMNGVLHGAALVDESGSVDVPITPFATAGTADIVVTKPQYQPVIETVVVATPAVIIIDPISIPIDTLTDVTISVYEEDGTTPIPDVNIEISGLGAFGTLQGITDTSGTCALNFGGHYGGTQVLNLRGWREGDGYNLFEEPMEVTGGSDLTNPDIWITTTFGLSDTFGLNMPGTAHFTQDETDCDYTIYVVDADTFITESLNDSITYTPTTLTDIYGYITKTGYNVYSELFTTVEVYGTVSGIVTESENGDPVPDIEVKFYEQGANPTTDDPLFTDITDAYGFYEITENQPVDYYDIHINEWGFNPYEELNYFLGYGSDSHDIVIDSVETAVVHGRIYDDDKGAVSNATITYYRSDNGEPYDTVYVSISGRYSVFLPYFIYDVYVSAPEHVPFRGSITIDRDLTVDYRLGLAALFSNFEDNDGDFSPTPPTGAWEWGEPTAGSINAYSGVNVWATNLDGYYVDDANWYLDSPEFTVPDNGILNFYHYHNFEGSKGDKTLWDGGNVKISNDGGTSFSLITPVNGYDGTISALGESGFGGTIGDWELVEFDISSYEGDNVIIRWHFASDGSQCDYYGWYIDDFLVFDPNSSEQIINPVSVNSTQITYKLELYQNYPNPVRTYTTISFSIPRDIATDLHRLAQIKIYNIKGQLVKKCEMQNVKCGMNSMVWNGKDDSGKPVANGIYFYRLSANNKNLIKKMIILR